MKLRIKRTLFLVHRWFGVAMCLLFALWFATGIIMMYVEYPELTEEERLAALAPLDFRSVSVPVGAAVTAAAPLGDVTTIALSTIGLRPAYRVRDDAGGISVVYADDGTRFTGHSPASAVAAAQHSGFAVKGPLATYDRTVDVDQWTVSAALDEHRPLHRVTIGDERGTVVYVSNTTGQIARDTDRAERAWNWLGSTIHWIYPFQLRRHVGVWTNLLIYLSVAGLVSVATGAVIGILRLRLTARYRGTDASPYHGAAKLHHVLGLVCLAFLSTFIFSGLMSMTPWGLFDSASSEAEQIHRYTHGANEVSPWPAIDWESLPANDAVKEVEWRRIAGGAYVVVSRSADAREVVVDGAVGTEALQHLRVRIESAAASLIPGAAIVSAAPVEEYDDYYYSRHNRYRPLPAYRVTFDDPEATWFYVDWSTGAVVLRYTTATRVQRWLYNGLHSLDFAALLRRGVVWDVVVIVLSLCGFVFAATSVVVGWRRVARTRRLAALTARA
jgi:uncharacterized iron-regulated membrane protein